MKQQPTPVFIVGSGRSGTTITASLLSQLPRVQIAKETGYIGQNLSLLHDIENPESLRQLIQITNSWLGQNHWENRASEEGFRDFCSCHQIHGASAFIHYVWQLDSPKPWNELSFIGDNTPLYVMAIPAIQELMPDARFIHIVRDPRDVVTSTLKMRFGADDIDIAALEWHVYLGCWLMAERIIPEERRMEFRYEDLCLAPFETLSRIAGFLNHTEPEAAAALERHAAAGEQQSTGFEKVAVVSHHARLTEPLAASRVGRYKKELSAAQIGQIEEFAQYGMLAYGYQPAKWQMHPLITEDRTRILRAMLNNFVRRYLKRLRGR